MTEMFGTQETPTPGSAEPFGSSNITGSGGSNDQSTKDAAKDEAKGVAKEGVQGGKHVATVATDQAREVVSEAGSQAQALLAEAKSELMDQAASQKNRVAEQLHTLAEELGSMARSSDQDGLASGLAQQASQQVGTIAHWVSEREPGSLVGELKDFARAKPGTFMAVAAGIGLVAGRMTRGVKAGPPEQVSASDPAFQPGITQGSSADRSVGSLPGDAGGYAGLSQAGPAVGVGGTYPDLVSEDPLRARTPGLTT